MISILHCWWGQNAVTDHESRLYLNILTTERYVTLREDVSPLFHINFIIVGMSWGRNEKAAYIAVQ